MPELLAFQEEAVDFLYAHDHTMVQAKVGAGKTAVGATVASELLKDGHIDRWLVLAPKRVCTKVWPKELALWAPDIKYAVAVGTPQVRRNAIEGRPKNQMVMLNFDNLQWFVEQYPVPPFDGLIIDELTKLGNSKGARFKALHEVIEQFKVRIGLTGSFNSNGLEGVFGQCKILSHDILGQSRHKYMKQYFWPLDAQRDQWAQKQGAYEEVMKRVRPYAYILEPEAYTDNEPNIVPVMCSFDLTDYHKLRRDLVLQLRDGTVNGINQAVVKNKLSQLACIAEGTPVLTNEGWLPIEQLGTQLLWDGVEWVQHLGVICKGRKSVATCHGVRMTYNHNVLTVSGWRTAKDILDGKSTGRFDRAPVWVPDSHTSGWSNEKKVRTVAVPMCVRERGDKKKSVSTEQKPPAPEKLRMPSRIGDPPHDEHPAISHLAGHAQPMYKPEQPRLPQLWRPRDIRVRAVAKKFCRILAGYARGVLGREDARQKEQQQRLHTEQLPVGYVARTGYEPQRQQTHSSPGGVRDVVTSRAGAGYADADAMRQTVPVQVAPRPRVKYACTYDILACGPRNRFVVKGEDGQPLIVHNCGFVYETTRRADPARPGKFISTKKPHRFSDHKLDALAELFEENQRANTLVVYEYEEDLARLQERFPFGKPLSDDVIDEWNSGKLPMMFMHAKSGGHGLNLQFGGYIIVWMTPPWPDEVELFEQVNGRLARRGQTKKVTAYLLLAEGTLDEEVYGALLDNIAAVKAGEEMLRDVDIDAWAV